MAPSDKNPVNIDRYKKNNQQGDTAADPSEKKGRPVSGAGSEMSRKAQELQKARKALKNIPDVREDKVARIKKQIENGTYEIDAEETAEKMIKESLTNDL
jgi:negative regulator of flagellin synthesis FlgM